MIKKEKFETVLRSLKYRNFRLYYTGQGISLIGTWMERVALSWLVYNMTGSAFILGVVGFAGQIPSFLLTPIAGVYVDRLNRHKLLITTQVLSMLQAFTVFFLVFTNTIQVWHIIGLSIFLGVINAFDMPTRQSFVVQMIDDPKDLSNAIALNSSLVNLSRLIGPSVAGILIALFGEAICFLLNALSYIAVVASLLMMRIKIQEIKVRASRVLQDLKEGFKYVAKFEPISAILTLLSIQSIAGMPYTVLMPLYAKDILHGGANTLGFLMGFVGIGALAGAIYLASRSTVRGLVRMVPVSAVMFSIGVMLFAFSNITWLSLLILLFVGYGQIVSLAASNSIIQTLVDEDKRGRVMSMYTLSFMGMMPIGSLISGSLASAIGAQWTLLSGGVICLLSALFFARRLPALKKKMRPIYVRKGIIPEIASGLSDASELTTASKQSGG